MKFISRCFYALALLVIFPFSSFAADTSECDLNSMLAFPTEEPYATQWRTPYCLNLLIVEVSLGEVYQKEDLASALDRLPNNYRETLGCVGLLIHCVMLFLSGEYIIQMISLQKMNVRKFMRPLFVRIAQEQY